MVKLNTRSIDTGTPDRDTQGDQSEANEQLIVNDVQQDLLHQPQLMMKTLLVAENLRDNYFRNTECFIQRFTAGYEQG